ncbi:hypothetical protein [Bacillus xiapuensis]|nr:hypothetical protein [Bacillus xiapuensis]
MDYKATDCNDYFESVFLGVKGKKVALATRSAGGGMIGHLLLAK